MKQLAYIKLGTSLFVLAALTIGQAPAAEPDNSAVFLGKVPVGILSHRLGQYLTIEGVQDNQLRRGANSLLVDTVNGKKLATPISIWVDNLTPPASKRCVLKGYEAGKMVGTPPAVFEAAKEQGRKAVDRYQVGWGWSPHFVALIVIEPKELTLPGDK